MAFKQRELRRVLIVSNSLKDRVTDAMDTLESFVRARGGATLRVDVAGPVADRSWSLAQDGGVMFRMLNLAWDELWAASGPDGLPEGEHAYRLTGITIVAKRPSELADGDVLCP